MALDEYGLHRILLKDCDDYIGGTLVASPADARGRGILFSMETDGKPVALTDAKVYLAWKHRVSRKRGCEPFTAVATDGLEWCVYYPAAMQETAGVVDGQIVVSLPGERTISTRVFGIRVEPVLIGGTESEDGFTLFVETIRRYEEGTERVDELLAVLDDVTVIKGDKGDKGDPGADGAPGKDGAPGRDGADGKDGEPGAPGRDGADGKDGIDGKDGVGIESVVQTTTSMADGGVNVVKVSLTDGTESTFEVRNGRAGTTGGDSAGGSGADGVGIASIEQTSTSNESGGENIVTVTLTDGQTSAFSVLNGAKGDKGDPGEKGADGATGAKGDKGDKGDPGEAGPQGIQGERGAAFTYEDFTAEQLAALKGEKGDKGEPGVGGEGASISAEAPLALSEQGVLSIDLSNIATKEELAGSAPDMSDYTPTAELSPGIWSGWNNPGCDSTQTNIQRSITNLTGMTNAKKGDYIIDSRNRRLSKVANIRYSGSTASVTLDGVIDWGADIKFMVSDEVDVASGIESSCQMKLNHSIKENTIILNPTTGNLMRVKSGRVPLTQGAIDFIPIVGLCNLYESSGGGQAETGFTAQAPLALADGVLTIDLGNYATKEYVTSTAPDLSQYALLSDVQQLRQEAASTYVLEEDLPDFTTYATKTEVTTAIDNALANLTNLEELNY